MRRAVTLSAAVACVVALAPAEAEAKTVEVSVGRLNVRSGPSSRRYRVIGVTSRGKRYTELGRSGSWVKIRFGSRDGWVYGPYTKVVADSAPKPPPKSTPKGTMYEVTARSAMNIRTGPSTRYRVVGRATRGTRLLVIGSSGSWKKLIFRSAQRWGHASLLRKAGSAPPPAKDGRRRSRAGFIALKASGPGFYSYQRQYRRWGTPKLIYGLERIGRKWPQGRPRIGIGDISLENGGRFAPHVSHRTGKDADIRPVKKRGEGPVTIYQSAYSRTYTQDLINALRRELPITLILFNDSKTRGRTYYRNHHNHLHARIR